MKFKRIYIEITNVCNLKCSFCSEVTKKRRFMTKDELYTLCKERGNVYCLEKYFSKHFLEFYIELKTFNFPQSFKFSQNYIIILIMTQN